MNSYTYIHNRSSIGRKLSPPNPTDVPHVIGTGLVGNDERSNGGFCTPFGGAFPPPLDSLGVSELILECGGLRVSLRIMSFCR